MLTHHGISPAFRDGFQLFMLPTAIGSVSSVSGHAIAYRSWSLPRVRWHGVIAVLKVVPVTGAAFSGTSPVLWFGTRVTCEMVSDRGGRLIPAGIVGLHTLSLLLASPVAHDRATEDNHTHHTLRISYTNIKEGTLANIHSWVQYISPDREVLTPSPCE